MKTRIVLGVAGVLILVLGATVWIGVEQLRGNSPAEQNKQALLEGIRQGRPLYVKTVRYYKGPVVLEGDLSHLQTTIAEDWVVADEQSQRVAAAWTLSDLEGNLLKYMKLHEDGTLTETPFLVEGFFHLAISPFFPVPGTEVAGIEDIELYFSELWDDLLALQDSGWEPKGRGTLDGRISLLFEHENEDGVTFNIEVVENAPLLHSKSIYEDGVLVSRDTVVEYKFLPPGTALPDPPSHVQTVNYHLSREKPTPSARQ